MSKTPVKVKIAKRGRLDEEIKYDVRLLKRHLREGSLNRADLEKYLKALPDVSNKVEAFSAARLEEVRGR